jgi:hypothetical protein
MCNILGDFIVQREIFQPRALTGKLKSFVLCNFSIGTLVILLDFLTNILFIQQAKADIHQDLVENPSDLSGEA